MGLLDKLTGSDKSGVEDMNAPPSSQGNTSIAKITALAVFLLPVLYMGLLYLANFLPDADAARVKGMIDSLLPTLIAAGGGGGTLALFVRSLMLTQGKIKNQTPAMPENVTAGGDVNLNQGNTSTPQPLSGSFEMPVEEKPDDSILIESLPTFDEIANR